MCNSALLPVSRIGKPLLAAVYVTLTTAESRGAVCNPGNCLTPALEVTYKEAQDVKCTWPEFCPINPPLVKYYTTYNIKRSGCRDPA